MEKVAEGKADQGREDAGRSQFGEMRVARKRCSQREKQEVRTPEYERQPELGADALMSERGESGSVERASVEHSRRRGRHGRHVARAAAACRLPFDRTFPTFTGICASSAASSVSSPAGQFLSWAVVPTLASSCARRRQFRNTVPQSSAGPRTLRPRQAPGPHSGRSRIPNPAVCAPRQASSTTYFRTIGTASRPAFLLARKFSISGAGPESLGARSSVLNHPCM